MRQIHFNEKNYKELKKKKREKAKSKNKVKNEQRRKKLRRKHTTAGTRIYNPDYKKDNK